MSQKQKAKVITADEKLKVLDTIASLMAERYGYDFGVKLLRSKMFSVTAQQMSDIKRLHALLEAGKINADEFNKQVEPIKKIMKEKRAPYLEKIRPLAEKVKGFDGYVKEGKIVEGIIPSALREAGYNITIQTEAPAQPSK